MPKLLEVLGWLANTWPEPGSKGLTQARMPLAYHSLVEEQSIARWIREQKVPKGETIFKVGFFLEAFFGVEIEEMNGSKKYEVKKLARTFGSGVISMEVLSEILDFADRADSVLRLLRGTSGTSQNRLEKIRTINVSYASQVENVRKNIELLKPHTVTPGLVKEKIKEHEVKVSTDLSSHEESILLYARMAMIQTMEIMEILVSAENPKVRDEFRRQMSSTLGRFSKLISSLTSEQARLARIADGFRLKEVK